MVRPETVSRLEQGGQIPPCPLEDFYEFWSETPEGKKVIPAVLVKNLISRRDGQGIEMSALKGVVHYSTMLVLKETGVVPVSKKYWDDEFVRHFWQRVQGGKRQIYQMQEINDEVLIRLRGLMLKVKTAKPAAVGRKPKLIKEIVGDDGEYLSFGGLVELGRRKKYVTMDDILRFSPGAEQDAGQLDEAFNALLSAGVPFVEDVPTGEPSEEELIAAEEAEPGLLLDDYLANIDTDDTIGLYFKEVGRVPLLTGEQEVELAKRIENGREARGRLARGRVSGQQRIELRREIEDGWQARDHLITANARLVISVAKKYMGRGVPFLDLIQEGNIGLIRTTKKFDYRRGHKFSTYATWWIRQAVTRSIADQGRTIRVPVHMGDQINKLLSAQHQLTQQLGRDPSVEELVDVLGIKPEKVEIMIRAARWPLSLEMPVGSEEDSILNDFIEDNAAAPPDDTVTANLLREYLGEILKDLPPREVKILQLRYGLIDGEAYTLEAVGRKMGVTRERVRQIETQALSRLRHPAVRQKLRDYLEE